MPVLELRTSSAIERVGYNDETRALSIWFRGGRRYVYSDVPRSVYDDLCRAQSAGRFVGEAIKGRYPCRPEHPRRFRPVG
jgi:hypothetical protein